MIPVQYSGAVMGVQLKPIAEELEGVARRPVGAVVGMEMQDVAEFVSALACVEGTEAPSASTAVTT